jgi:hypothetical protein
MVPDFFVLQLNHRVPVPIRIIAGAKEQSIEKKLWRVPQ